MNVQRWIKRGRDELSTPPVLPDESPARLRNVVYTTLRTVGLIALIAAISAASAYAVFEWRIKSEQQGTAEQVAALRGELRQQQSDLAAKVDRVEKAAESARILMNQNGEVTSLEARLKEIDTLKLEVQKAREDMETKLQTVEKSVVEQVAKQGKETAQALSQEMRWKSLLIKAQGEVLLAQIHWTEGNRGLAKDELSIAATSLLKALEAAPEANKAALKQVADLAEQAKASLILEQSSSRDSLNLLWHRVSELLAN